MSVCLSVCLSVCPSLLMIPFNCLHFRNGRLQLVPKIYCSHFIMNLLNAFRHNWLSFGSVLWCLRPSVLYISALATTLAQIVHLYILHKLYFRLYCEDQTNSLVIKFYFRPNLVGYFRRSKRCLKLGGYNPFGVTLYCLFASNISVDSVYSIKCPVCI